MSPSSASGRVRARPGPSRGTVRAVQQGSASGNHRPGRAVKAITSGRPAAVDELVDLVSSARHGSGRAHGRAARLRQDLVIRFSPLWTPGTAARLLDPGQVGGVLVGAVDRGVDRDLPIQLAGGVGLGEETGVDLVPGPVGAEPACVASTPSATARIPPGDPATRSRSEAGRRCPRSPDDGHGTAAPAAPRRRHQRLDPGPVRIVKTVQRDITPPSRTTPRT